MCCADVTVLRDNDDAVARIELGRGMSIKIHEHDLPYRIGRGSDCDLTICDGHISRHHCELVRIRGVLCLRDTSSNGTYLDGHELIDGCFTLQERTDLNLGGSVSLKIFPEARGIAPERRTTADRRQIGRRHHAERRCEVFHVDFERRQDDERRCPEDRRAAERRSASA